MSSGLACLLVLLLSVPICKHKWRCVCHVHEGNYHHYCLMEASSDSSQYPLPSPFQSCLVLRVGVTHFCV